MRNRLAFLLSCSVSTVSLAATTHLHKTWFQSEQRAFNGQELAEEFITQNEKTLGLPLSSLRLVRQQNSLAATHYVYQQVLGNNLLAGATVTISVLNDQNAVFQYYSTLSPKAVAPTTKTLITSEQAYDAAWNYVGVSAPLFQAPKAQLIYRGEGEKVRLVYSVELSPKAPYGAWRVDVDAQSGKIINVTDLRVNEKALTIPSTFGTKPATYDRKKAFSQWTKLSRVSTTPPTYKAGTALVFDPDPLTELGVTDLKDASPASAFEKAYVQRVLPEMSFESDTYILKGPWVTVIDFDPPTDAPTTSKDGKWAFKRGDEGFTDGMVFYHLDQSQRYIQSLGFKDDKGIQYKSIEADADGADGDDNSYFMPSTNRLAFGHGCIDDDEDADVILHEYGHALHFSINPDWGGGDTGAIGEGLGDYWAASYSYSTPKGHDFQPEKVYNWDSSDSCWPGRVLNATGARYVAGSFYGAHATIAGGYQSDELWSTPIFQAHEALRAQDVPRSEIDTVILEAQFGLGAGVTMPELAQSIVDTAKRLYPEGPHAEVFRQKFVAQNILLEPKPVIAATLGDLIDDADGVADPGESLHYPLTLKNTGDLLAQGVTVTFTTTDKYVQDLPGAITVGDLKDGASQKLDLTLKLAGDTPCGYWFSFQINVSTKDGRAWTIPVTYATGKAQTTSGASSPNIAIPDNNLKGISDAIALDATAVVTDHLTVDVNIKHTYQGDLKVVLKSPQGTEVALHDRTGSSADNIIGTYPTTLKPDASLATLIGEKLDGTWTLTISDDAASDTGSLISWGLTDISGYLCQ